MASIANWVIILVIITSITFIRLGIIIITFINIILLFHKKKIFENETLKLYGKRNTDAYHISVYDWTHARSSVPVSLICSPYLFQ